MSSMLLLAPPSVSKMLLSSLKEKPDRNRDPSGKWKSLHRMRLRLWDFFPMTLPCHRFIQPSMGIYNSSFYERSPTILTQVIRRDQNKPNGSYHKICMKLYTVHPTFEFLMTSVCISVPPCSQGKKIKNQHTLSAVFPSRNWTTCNLESKCFRVLI